MRSTVLKPQIAAGGGNIAFVQDGVIDQNNGAASTQVFNVSKTTTANHKLIMCVWTGASQNANSVTDSRGNTWTRDEQSVSGARRLTTFSTNNTTALQSGDTVSVVLSGSTGAYANCVEFSGIKTTSYIDFAADNSNGTSNSPSGPATGTLAHGNDLIISTIQANGATTLTKPTGYTAFTVTNGVSGQYAWAYKIKSSDTTGETPAWTATNTPATVLQTLAYIST